MGSRERLGEELADSTAHCCVLQGAGEHGTRDIWAPLPPCRLHASDTSVTHN